MSRKIKYRVWNTINKSYDDVTSSIYYAIDQDGELGAYCHGDAVELPDEDKEGTYTVEQYTGLTDKNGKEIYEGDIVRTKSNGEPCTAEICWSDVTLTYYLNSKKCGYVKLCFQVGWSPVEVIGNVHENPELVRGEDE